MASDGCARGDTDVWSGNELTAATRLQRGLLPPSPWSRGGWTAAHVFAPAGPVGGDMVDLIRAGDRLYFLLADVSGKGVAASLLTTYVHAVFRSLVPFDLPVEEVVRRASALLCASTLPAQYATIVFGSLGSTGEVVLANAGHPPALILGDGGIRAAVATGTAAGLFCDSEFGSAHFHLAAGETLLLYSDGVTEAFDASGREYGQERLEATAASAGREGPEALVAAITGDHARFLDGCPASDDVTLLAIRHDRAAVTEN